MRPRRRRRDGRGQPACVAGEGLSSIFPSPGRGLDRGRAVQDMGRWASGPIRSGMPRGSIGAMSIDKSLKKAGGLTRARNVLTRAERLALLQEDDRWSPAKGVYNLPKTKYRRLAPGQSGPRRPAELKTS